MQLHVISITDETYLIPLELKNGRIWHYQVDNGSVLRGTDTRFERKISGRFSVRQRRKVKSLLSAGVKGPEIWRSIDEEEQRKARVAAEPGSGGGQ